MRCGSEPRVDRNSAVNPGWELIGVSTLKGLRNPFRVDMLRWHTQGRAAQIAALPWAPGRCPVGAESKWCWIVDHSLSLTCGQQ
jgi:hypothetical protein